MVWYVNATANPHKLSSLIIYFRLVCAKCEDLRYHQLDIFNANLVGGWTLAYTATRLSYASQSASHILFAFRQWQQKNLETIKKALKIPQERASPTDG